jgi:hypothetical protein
MGNKGHQSLIRKTLVTGQMDTGFIDLAFPEYGYKHLVEGMG